jgi:hypothetical protein
MSRDRETVKAELIAEATRSGVLRKATDEELGARIAELALELEALNPTPDPTRRPDLYVGRWKTLFSTFNLEMETTLARLSFGKLSSGPITVGELYQEVGPEDADCRYDNVVTFTDAAGKPGAKVMLGRFSVDDGHKLGVVFYEVFATPEDDRSIETFKADAGIAPDGVVRRVIEKTPPLHSSIIYLDDDLRLNRGVYGGVYVLQKVSADYTPTRLRAPELETA